MRRQLLLMRHAKSDPGRPGADFERPLNDQGRESLKAMGQWLETSGYLPDILYSSPAKRAAETATGVCRYVRYAETAIRWESGLYLASLENLLSFLLNRFEAYSTMMIVGHNPGMESLLRHITQPAVLEGYGVLLPPAGFAHLETTLDVGGVDNVAEWVERTRTCADLKVLLHPEQLKK